MKPLIRLTNTLISKMNKQQEKHNYENQDFNH
jgi:hypothetical protein